MEALQLTNENIFPDEAVLKATLGGSFNTYQALLEIFEENSLIHEWRYYKDGKAWLCKVQYKKKTVVWMSAWKGYLKASIYMPERLCEDLFNTGISEDTIKRIKETRKIGKSIACTFEIRNKKALKDLEKVMKFKMLAK